VLNDFIVPPMKYKLAPSTNQLKSKLKEIQKLKQQMNTRLTCSVLGRNKVNLPDGAKLEK
jgi:hypothetical protein